jgi:hypothetical protein
MAGTGGSTTARQTLLGIYLNDHLAGATGGLELVRRSAAAHRGSPIGATMSRLAAEIEQDRESLQEVMASLHVPVRHYKIYSAWAAEKVGRLKLNGRLLDRSPLSSLIELEALRLGVEGKASLWRTLREVATSEPRLDVAYLDRLLARATDQVDTLESLRLRAAAEAFLSS